MPSEQRVAALAAVLTTIIGIAIGVVTGSRPHSACDVICSWIGSVADAVSPFLLSACVVAALPRSPRWFVLLVVILSSTPYVANSARAQVIYVMQSTQYKAAIATGLSSHTRFWRYVLPDLWRTIGPLSLSLVAGFVALLTALSFIGLGAASGIPDIGSLLYDSLGYVDQAPDRFLCCVGSLLAILVQVMILERLVVWAIEGESVLRSVR